MLRFLFAIPQAAVVTTLLLMLMISLIRFSGEDLDQSPRIRLPDIHMPESTMETQRRIEKPEKPEVDETPPPEIPEQDFDRIDGNAAVGEIITPDHLQTRLDLRLGTGLQVTDGEYLPIVQVAPEYPIRALNRGIEGHVVLEYTVTPQGTVKDVVVVESEPEGVFDKAAIQSAERYKYRPRIIDGKAVEVRGVRSPKIIFELAK